MRWKVAVKLFRASSEFPVTTLPWMHRRIPVHRLARRGGEVRIEDLESAMTHATGSSR
jgi:hypothetical protein